MKKHVLALVLLITMLIGGTQTYGQTVTINPSATSICSGSGTIVALTAVAGGIVTNYAWSNGVTGIDFIDVSPLTTTTYSIIVTFLVGAPDTASVTVTVNPTPTPTISPIGLIDICAGNSVVLTTPTIIGASYQWSLGGSIIPGAISSSYSASATGLYQVNVVLGTCSGISPNTSVTVKPLPTIIMTPLANDTVTICSGSSTVFSAGLNPSYTYQWQFWSGTWTDIGGEINNSYTANTTGLRRVNVTLNGCTVSSNP